ncbi:MAG: hypothetical protein ACYDGM_03225 [Vulcanimicrobiaceae bacterium]
MVLFPPMAAVAIRVNGAPVATYIHPYEAHGEVFAPVRPFITRFADRLWFERGTLVIERDGRRVRVRLPARMPDALDRAYVAIAPILRALGERVQYDPHRRLVEVRSTSDHPITAPTPFVTLAHPVAPRVVFTPVPVATARPVWTGPAIPRRTPIPRLVPTPSP